MNIFLFLMVWGLCAMSFTTLNAAEINDAEISASGRALTREKAVDIGVLKKKFGKDPVSDRALRRQDNAERCKQLKKDLGLDEDDDDGDLNLALISRYVEENVVKNS